jgi:hypothetical protein
MSDVCSHSNQMCLVVKFLPKISNSFLLTMASDEEWYKKFRGSVRKASKGNGCIYCSTGNCFTAFGDPEGENELRKWHREWSIMSLVEQDVHLLWIFHAGSGSCDELLPDASSRIDTSIDESDGSEDRIPTSENDDSESDARIATSSEDHDSDSDADSSSASPSKRPRREYNSGKPRREACGFAFLGHKICRTAALRLMRVGINRLERVRDGRLDGRRDCPHVPGKMETGVWRFLWTLYHTVGEGMPDKFSFSKGDADTLVIGACKTLKHKAPGARLIEREDIDAMEATINKNAEPDVDQHERAIASHAMYVVSHENPVDSALVGPGIFRGPLRFLPPSKRLHLYWEYRVWMQNNNLPTASFSTFLRAFGKCTSVLRIRNSGKHAVCTTCKEFKQQLGRARFPQNRQRILEQYTAHVVNQWLDRQVYGNAMSVSLECRRLLNSGELMINLAYSTSQICMAVDGMDQAKFRLPRIHVQTKSLDRLIRPALHVQGAWAHGFGYHMAIMDADMKHDTNNNVEVISQMLEQIFVGHKGLPLGLHLQQDNTSRECKNQKILKWAVKLVSLGVFRWVTLNYLTVGHTHDNLDGTFGQITVRLATFEFDDDTDVVAILMQLLGGLGIDHSSRRASLAYKMDEAYDWEAWWDEITVSFSKLTGPRAPHSFRVMRRQDLGVCSRDRSETDTKPESLPGHQDAGGDVVVVVKHYMHSKAVTQIFTAWPESCSQALHRHPSNQHARRLIRPTDGAKLTSTAEDLHRLHHISAKARDYLVEWATCVRRRKPKPEEYTFLSHSFKKSHFLPVGNPPPLEVHRVQVQGVAVAGAQAELLPDGADSADDQDEGDLVIFGE